MSLHSRPKGHSGPFTRPPNPRHPCARKGLAMARITSSLHALRAAFPMSTASGGAEPADRPPPTGVGMTSRHQPSRPTWRCAGCGHDWPCRWAPRGAARRKHRQRGPARPPHGRVLPRCGGRPPDRSGQYVVCQVLRLGTPAPTLTNPAPTDQQGWVPHRRGTSGG
jgi:hypothetical protein